MVFSAQVRISEIKRRRLTLSSVPAGVAVFVLILISLPGNIPYRETSSDTRQRMRSYWSDTSRRVDFPGTGLLLGAGLLLITALQLAGSQYSWSSAAVIVLLVLAVVLAIAFFAWEYTLSLGSGVREPVFPWRFLSNRVWMLMLL